MNIKVIIEETEFDTTKDDSISNTKFGALFRNADQYYLVQTYTTYNESIRKGDSGYKGIAPVRIEVSESNIPNKVDSVFHESYLMFPDLPEDEMILRRVCKAVTLLSHTDALEILCEEIKRSKVDIGNAIIIESDGKPLKFDGYTYSWHLHNCDICTTSANEIHSRYGDYIRINPEDQLFRKKIDGRGYPPSCGVENAEKDVIMIIKEKAKETPGIGEVRDLSKGE